MEPQTANIDSPTKPRPIVLLGPTAGGKSELAVGLAERLGGEVIGADSMQVYRHMEAGTAKPSSDLRGRVTHHMIDIVEPTQRFTVADWLERVDPLIERLQGASVRPIVVGGTNLYLKALLEGLFEGPSVDPGLREELMAESGERLHERLRAVDPESADRIHPNDMKKLVRALEVYLTSGTPISRLQTQWKGAGSTGEGYRYDPVLIGLEWPVEAINRRINLRVKGMFCPQKVVVGEGAGLEGDHAESLPEEVARLHERGWLGPQASEALGYRQVLDSLEGRCTLEEAYEKTKILTRRFAKSQRSWLRRFRMMNWVQAADCSQPVLLDEIMNIITD